MEATLHANGVIDTDILIDAMHGIPNAITFLDQQQEVGIQISIISAMELVAGCRNKVEITELEKFLEKITCLPVTATAKSITGYSLVLYRYHPDQTLGNEQNCNKGGISMANHPVLAILRILKSCKS